MKFRIKLLHFLLCLLAAIPTLRADCDGVPPVEFYQSATLCAGDTLYVGAVRLFQGGNFQTQLETTAGCDSIVYTYIQLLPSYDQLSFQALCPGDTFRGMPYVRDTVLVEAYLTTAGCDSILRYELDVIEGPTVSVEGATEICANALTQLQAPPGYADYVWSDGSTTADIEVGPGDYEVTLTNSIGCAFVQTHTITGYEPLSEVAVQNPLCPDAADGQIEVLLSIGGLAPYSYELVGEQEPTADTLFSDLAAGNYTLCVTDALGCAEELEIELMAPSESQIALSGLPTGPVAQGDTVTLLLAVPDNYQALRWRAQGVLSCFDCPDPVWLPGGDGSLSYELITESGCVLVADYKVELVNPQRLYFPNAFSPNGDTANDVYRLGAAENVVRIVGWRVFDRWGAQLVGRQDLTPDADLWDGRGAPVGVYVYAATVAFANGSVATYSGEIHLLR